jgi:hypothetical protein
MTTPAQKQRMKILQGYVKSPARCVNCTHYAPPEHASPATIYRAATVYAPARCKIGGFAVEAHAICDNWVHDRPQAEAAKP